MLKTASLFICIGIIIFLYKQFLYFSAQEWGHTKYLCPKKDGRLTDVIKLSGIQKYQLNIIKQNVILSAAKNLLVSSNQEVLRHKCLRMTYFLLS